MTNSREGVLGNHLTAPTYFRQRGAVPSENDAKMELHRLHAQLHDRLPRPLWGVDRVDVGLHVGGNTFPQKMPDLIFHKIFTICSGGLPQKSVCLFSLPL